MTHGNRLSLSSQKNQRQVCFCQCRTSGMKQAIRQLQPLEANSKLTCFDWLTHSHPPLVGAYWVTISPGLRTAPFWIPVHKRIINFKLYKYFYYYNCYKKIHENYLNENTAQFFINFTVYSK